jgi:hypothetical protein
VAFPVRPENSMFHDSSLLSESNVTDADPKPSLSTGGTSCEGSRGDAVHAKMLAYAGLTLLEIVPIKKINPKNIVNILKCINNNWIFLLIRFRSYLLYMHFNCPLEIFAGVLVISRPKQ